MELGGAKSRRLTLGRLKSAAADKSGGEFRRVSACQAEVSCFERKTRVGDESVEPDKVIATDKAAVCRGFRRFFFWLSIAVQTSLV